MLELIICTSLVIVFYVYNAVSRMHGSYVNIFFFTLIIFIPSSYLSEIFRLAWFGPSGSNFAYFYSYFCYTIYLSTLMLASQFAPYMEFSNKPYRDNNVFILGCVFLLTGYIVYSPILLEFREYIFTPREIYVKTRTGYGISYFLSSTLAFLAAILFLFSPRDSFMKHALVFFGLFLSVLLIYFHGSKGQILSFIFIVLLYQVYIKERRFSFIKTALYLFSISIIAATLFWITLPPTMKEDFLEGFVSYSDYTKNGMMVIDSGMPIQYGRLTLEGNIYTHIPRLIYPDKPKDFGTFYLASIFYSDWFSDDTGSPSFGLVGQPYADFGVFAVFYLFLVALINGVLIRSILVYLQHAKSPAPFLLLCYLADISLIPTGQVGSMLPEHLVIAAGISLLIRVQFSIGDARASRIFPGLKNEA